MTQQEEIETRGGYNLDVLMLVKLAQTSLKQNCWSGCQLGQGSRGMPIVGMSEVSREWNCGSFAKSKIV